MRTEKILYLALNRLSEGDVKSRKTNGFRLIASRDVHCGSEHAFRLPLGFSAADVQQSADTLISAVGSPVEVIDRAGAVVIRVVKKDFPRVLPARREDIRNNGLLIGYDRLMNPMYHPLNTHLLIGGASNSGKTDATRFWIWQLAQQGYDIRICDLKGFSFFPFETLPNVSVAKTLAESHDMLVDSAYELIRRKEMIIRVRDRGVIKNLRPIVVVIDEAASLSPRQNQGKAKQVAQQCDDVISMFGQQAREPKMFMLYCTQRPSMDVINLQFRANVEAMIAFRTRDKENSKLIIGREGAERISPLTPGRCIYAFDRDYTLQVPYVGDDEAWEKLLAPKKVEVIQDGNSRRTEPARVYIDGSFSSSNRNDKATSNVERFTGATEEGVKAITGPGAKQTGFLEMAQPGKGMGANKERTRAAEVYSDEISD